MKDGRKRPPKVENIIGGLIGWANLSCAWSAVSKALNIGLTHRITGYLGIAILIMLVIEATR